MMTKVLSCKLLVISRRGELLTLLVPIPLLPLLWEERVPGGEEGTS